MQEQQVVGIDGLAAILHKTPGTIAQDRLRRPDSLPPALVPPGARRPLWIVADVIAWLRQQPETALPGQRRKTKAVGDGVAARAAESR